ncbi:ATP-binding cassette, subfamily B [Actinopolymorpha cephalotaxi]|uniref:ATP-binding cassette subfamily B protein n=1 Tax=Actinopolymorpha cephalotaxi TaxID=504797 RepID=A0A1I3AA98_9ACTN|nr:ATP-binding cassette domain-containing protein [Actinopolymorpha cephalotaxi]NYH85251.1 ATP-binding cassette subfamily B protein [Actinopolymorpha cephalotaxi]SFH47004.1 ATP-binding cassette, subfamily B [Actinopolymorpha cephalotaxi]
MTSWRHTWRLLFGIGREIGVVVCVLHVLVVATSFLGPLLLALGLRPLVDGAASGDSRRIAVGGVLSGLALLLSALAPVGYRWAVIRMRERSQMVVQRRLLTLSASAPGLAHIELPAYRDRLELLKQRSDDLADGLTLFAIGPITVVQLAVTALLLGRLQPLLLVIPLLAIPAVRLARKAERLRNSAELRTAADRRSAQDLFALATNPASGAEVRVHGVGADLVDRHGAASRTRHRVVEAALFRSVCATVAVWLCYAAAFFGAVVLVLRQVAAGEASAGDVAMVLALAAAVISAAGQLSSQAGAAMRVHTAAGHYHWLEREALREAGRTAAAPERLAGGITLDGVHFAYPGTDRPVLTDLSLHLPAGAVVALVGENGAGKTTLVKLLTGMYEPTAGRISVDGVDLTRLDPGAYRERITAGFQDYARFELAVRESVGVGDLTRMADDRAVRAALDAAGADFVERLPAGLDTPLGAGWDGGAELSGGQWQRLALARAAMRRRPLLVVLDEPTAALDPHAEHALFERVAADARQGRVDGRITLLVSHRFSTVRMADLIVVLSDGRVSESGTHSELLAQDGLYADLYNLQAESYR